jgi:hypothetical protein
MKIRLRELRVTTHRTTERIPLSETVTFLHGPVSTGKSTVARLVSFCFGGALEQTPAIKQEFVAAELDLEIGQHSCRFERALTDTSHVRVSWTRGDEMGSVNAPISGGGEALVEGDNISNLSDLVFFLSGLTPIRVRRSKRDPQSPLVRLGFRDLLRFCYLDQGHLDSSFYRLDEPVTGLKSRDAMRFFTGMHSDRLSQLEQELDEATDKQRSKREAVVQIRIFMEQFEFESEGDLLGETAKLEAAIAAAESRRDVLEATGKSETHALEPIRDQLRTVTTEVAEIECAIQDLGEMLEEHNSLRSELITSKTKLVRVHEADRVLEGAVLQQCPECGVKVDDRPASKDSCRLCGEAIEPDELVGDESEALRRYLNERIDEIGSAISRRREERERQGRRLAEARLRRADLDGALSKELERYDTAYISSLRAADREVAALRERIVALRRFQEVPKAILCLEEEAGALQGAIDRLSSSVDEERARLRNADSKVARIASRFHELMLGVGFPGVFDTDRVHIDTRAWQPHVEHDGDHWGFYDAGSGGKKVLYNVLFALSLHGVASELDMPVPSFLIIDSPTKNISEDENPQIVSSLYDMIYSLASRPGNPTQFILIDSDLVSPSGDLPSFSHRRMAGTPDEPSLIPYYAGP